VIAGQVGIAGSVRIGDYVMFGGQAAIGDRARIEDQAMIGGGAGVLPGKLVRRGVFVWGTPARPLKEYKETYRHITSLPKLVQKVDELAERVNAASNQNPTRRGLT
jgi:UDP-3-O-[3-hydroxymyristoyl] glucosamine N-acyltransferase